MTDQTEKPPSMQATLRAMPVGGVVFIPCREGEKPARTSNRLSSTVSTVQRQFGRRFSLCSGNGGVTIVRTE